MVQQTVTSSWTTLSGMARAVPRLTAFVLVGLLVMHEHHQKQYGSEAVPLLRSDPRARPVVVVPPRAYFLCWKGVCDPRLWDDMVKRTPYYSFGLGKRSEADDVDLNADPPSMDDDDDDDHRYGTDKRARYGFGVGKKDDNNQRFRFGLGKRSGRQDDARRFSFGLGKRSADDDAADDHGGGAEAEVEDDVDKRRSSYDFGLGKRDKTYSFGLGKRERMYSFGLGKRSAAAAAAPRFADYPDAADADAVTVTVNAADDGARRADGSRDDQDKRAKFAFGLGKRSNGQPTNNSAASDGAGKSSKHL